jgi:hypothetical protein
MGIINNDVYVCSNGVEKTGTYISFAMETIYVVQNYSGMTAMPDRPNAAYSVRANYRVFWDQDCREAGKSFIDLKSILTTLTSEQLNTNIYSILYEQLKTVYPNSDDKLTAKEKVAAAVPAPSGSVPSESVPSESVPSAAVPSAAVPSGSVPSAAVPAPAPSDPAAPSN